MAQTTQQKDIQSTKQTTLSPPAEPLVSSIAYNGHAGLALQCIQAGKNNPLQMKQGVMLL
ncbi:MAG: hypothetical protein K0S11_111 [Gammaproteobacteria bacterium]|nr:hypothetical protein [Gammaproteobacteria bacterium]